MFAGTGEAEISLGFTPGSYAKVLSIANVVASNACFSPSSPYTIHFSDEYLEHPDTDPYYSAMHEASHLLDEHLGLSDGEFTDLYNRIRELCFEFFGELDESSFFGKSTSLGHSKDSAKELFASLFCSLHYPEGEDQQDWERRIDQKSERFQGVYRECLGTLRNALEGCEEIKNDAPIHKNITSALTYFGQRKD